MSTAQSLNKRIILGLIVVAAVLTATRFGGFIEEEEQRPPVILISLDTLRADHAGFMGYPRETTPFLDELARESMVLDHANTTMCWTLIAHKSHITRG